jgi:hypothetical protein
MQAMQRRDNQPNYMSPPSLPCSHDVDGDGKITRKEYNAGFNVLDVNNGDGVREKKKQF